MYSITQFNVIYRTWLFPCQCISTCLIPVCSTAYGFLNSSARFFKNISLCWIWTRHFGDSKYNIYFVGMTQKTAYLKYSVSKQISYYAVYDNSINRPIFFCKKVLWYLYFYTSFVLVKNGFDFCYLFVTVAVP